MVQALRDIAVTVLLWGYFTIGYLLIFLPQHLSACVISREREAGFQRVNSRFYRGFFRWLGWLVPGLRLAIDPALHQLRGAVLVCNHRSYLDPLLLIALFPRHRTIVTERFFRMPFFGWVLRQSGYLPAGQDEGLLRQIESMPPFLAAGGNLFVFPEGRRGAAQTLAPFGHGAFRIARRCLAPVALLALAGSETLFQPGRWRFVTGQALTVRLDLVSVLYPDPAAGHGPVSQLMSQARAGLQAHLDRMARGGEAAVGPGMGS